MRKFLIFWVFAALPGAWAAEPLAVAVAEKRQVELTYAADGVVEAARQSTVSAQISGRIREITFDVGDAVKKGQVLVRIDDSEVSQALSESQAVLAQAEANYENAKANYERSKRLFEQKFVSQAALDRAEAEYRSAQSQVAARRAGAGIAANTRSYATVIAPYAGVVLSRHVEIGETVAPGKPLMTGFDPSELRVVANVSQDKIGAVRANHAASVELPALGRRVKPAAITVKPGADVRTHTTQVRLDLPSNMADVYPGMYARAHFVVGRAEKLLVPASAVLYAGPRRIVFVDLGEGRLAPRAIEIGAGNGEVYEVLSGLEAGETVVSSGNFLVAAESRLESALSQW
ncbi:MAG TPA: efflux RND transporter periplasmic adaptor subunit [Burkholderiales bacterium]